MPLAITKAEEFIDDVKSGIISFFCTLFHCLIHPSKITSNTALFSAPGKPIRRYINSTTYLVICIFAFLGFYRTMLFEREYNLDLNSLSSFGTYVQERSIFSNVLEILFILIILYFFNRFILSFILYCIHTRRRSDTAQISAKRQSSRKILVLGDYFSGTLMLVYLALLLILRGHKIRFLSDWGSQIILIIYFCFITYGYNKAWLKSKFKHLFFRKFLLPASLLLILFTAFIVVIENTIDVSQFLLKPDLVYSMVYIVIYLIFFCKIFTKCNTHKSMILLRYLSLSISTASSLYFTPIICKFASNFILIKTNMLEYKPNAVIFGEKFDKIVNFRINQIDTQRMLSTNVFIKNNCNNDISIFSDSVLQVMNSDTALYSTIILKIHSDSLTPGNRFIKPGEIVYFSIEAKIDSITESYFRRRYIEHNENSTKDKIKLLSFPSNSIEKEYFEALGITFK